MKDNIVILLSMDMKSDEEKQDLYNHLLLHLTDLREQKKIRGYFIESIDYEIDKIILRIVERINQ